MSQTEGHRLRQRHNAGTSRRPPAHPTDTIQKIRKNLEPLKQNTKKKLAQTIYYQNHPNHQSPLARDEKEPVHQRLGVKQIRLKRLVPLGTNTSSILPKRKYFKHPPQNNNKIQNTPGQFKRFKLQRVYSAQSRIERIRSQQRNNSIIKLRRLTTGLPPATNLTVEVKNPNFIPVNNGQGYRYQNGIHKFKMILNSKIQADILEIQKDSTGTIGPLPPLTRITPVTTEVPISERFGLL